MSEAGRGSPTASSPARPAIAGVGYPRDLRGVAAASVEDIADAWDEILAA